MTSWIRKAVVWSRLPWNTVMFSVRRRLRWRRGEATLEHESKTDLFDYLPVGERTEAEVRERELRDRYRLQPLADRSTRVVYRDNLWLLDVLDRWLDGGAWAANSSGDPRAIDVGSGAFAYAFGLTRWLASIHGGERGALTGIELDGHGVYRDGFARVDWAQAFARQATGDWQVGYRVADFSAESGPAVDCLTMCYPFVRRYPLVAWGLPLSAFGPERLFTAAVDRLRVGGRLFVLTQTEVEAQRVIELATATNRLRMVDSSPLRSRLVRHFAATENRVGIAFVRESGATAELALEDAASAAQGGALEADPACP